MQGTLPKKGHAGTQGTRSYVKAETGNRVWKYDVTGTAEEIKAFEATQDKVVINEFTGNPIFFSITNYGESVELGISQKGNVYANTEDADALKDQIKQYGPEYAKAVAAEMARRLFAGSTPVSVNTEVEEESDADLGNLGG